jgi:Ca2+-binding EF-hand superfamily protein
MTTGAVALGAIVVAGASVAGGGHHGRGEGGAWLFETYDADGDGRITQAEIDQVRQGQLQKFDANGDGSLSLEEYQALWLDAMRERMVDRFQAHDDDGDGQVTVVEFNESFDGLITRLDRNDDGAVTQDELRRGHRDRDRDRDDDDQ